MMSLSVVQKEQGGDDNIIRPNFGEAAPPVIAPFHAVLAETANLEMAKLADQKMAIITHCDVDLDTRTPLLRIHGTRLAEAAEQAQELEIGKSAALLNPMKNKIVSIGILGIEIVIGWMLASVLLLGV
jgi:hypothetical protein